MIAVITIAAWMRGSVPPTTAAARAMAPSVGAAGTTTSGEAERTASLPAAYAVPATAEDLVRDGAIDYSRGDFASALVRFEAAAAAHPNDPEALNNLGQALVRLNRPQEAVRKLEAAVGLTPGKWAYRFNLARARGLSGDWNAAVEDYRAAERLFPDDHATLFNLALALRKSGRGAEALPILERAATLEPDDASFLLTLGRTYDELDRASDAAGTYRKFLSTAASSADADAVRARLAQLEKTDSVRAAPIGLPDADRQR